ncbi:trichohyalin-like [Montipora foliosa]|uniref:trichohyalin-like n=1 Tax=Montipora foliosa TaxID=591990 RepID=UPI0035F1DF7B
MAAIVEWIGKDEALSEIFNRFDKDFTGELTAEQLQELHASIRDGGISLPQVLASIEEVCACETCDESELFDVLNEMDRRYYLVRDLQWEFAMMDREDKGTISERDARFLFQAVHDDFFSHRRFLKFLRSRAAPGSGISFAEIEVQLCNIPTLDWLEEEKQDDDKQKEEALRRKQEKEIAEQEARKAAEKKAKLEREAAKRKEDAARRKAEGEAAKRKAEQEELERKAREKEEEEDRKKYEEEMKKLSEEEAKLREEEESLREEEAKRLAEEDRKRREQEEAAQKWKKEELLRQQELEREKEERERQEREQREREEAMAAEDLADEAEEAERAAAEEARLAAEAAKKATDEAARKAAVEAEKKALAEAMANKEKKLRANLKGATKSKKVERIEGAVKEAKNAKMPGLKKDIDEAETTLKNVKAGEDLRDAIKRRHLEDLEKSMAHIRKNGWEKDWAIELKEGEKLAQRLRRLEKLKAEIMELKQSVISEIRSYQNPPPAVHKVMIATYLLLNYPEKDLLNWKNMQALLGKTGKEGLKRQVTSLDPLHVDMSKADFAFEKYLKETDLETIRDTSAGAATFYVWATNMIEEVHAVAEQKEKLLEEERKRKAEEAEEARKAAERKKARDAAKKAGTGVRRTSQETRGRSNSRGSRDTGNTAKSPARPGVARRQSSKSPAARSKDVK